MVEQKFIEETLKFEGGFVNDPDDKGGETYRGISRKYHPKWVGWVLVDSRKPLKKGEIIIDPLLNKFVLDFYITNYFNGHFDKMPLKLGAYCFDLGVHVGVMRAKCLLQKALKVNPDGVLGKKTMLALAKADIDKVIEDLKKERVAFYMAIASKTPSQSKFLKGWVKRAIDYGVALA